MEFGLFFLMQRDEAWTEPDVYDSGLEQMLAAEALGYSLGVDRRAPLQRLRSVSVAARARGLRGRPHDHPATRHGREPAPLHHPVDLAEQLAVLDVVSGDGSTLVSAAAAPCRITRPSSPIAATAGRGWRKASSSSGGHGAARPSIFRDASIPRSVSTCARGRPSVRIRRCSSPPTARTACSPPPASACPPCRPSSCPWRSSRSATRSIATPPSPPAGPCPRSRSWSGAPGACAWSTSLRTGPRRCGPSRRPSWAISGACRCCARTPRGICAELLRPLAAAPAEFREYLADGWALVGTPDEVRDDLQKFREATGYERVLLVMALPGLDTGRALRSMRLFAEHIAPVMVLV